MYRTKKDVDKLVENLLSKQSEKEFQSRAYSVAYKYYEVKDYVNCQKYVEQYLKHKDNNAAAYKLLGQAFNKIGQKEKAIEQFMMSLDIDPEQTSTILDICEILADDEVVIDPGRAKLWCEKAVATYPRHPVTFKLRERLTTISNPNPEALITLLTSELTIRPKEVLLHARLLGHYLNINKAEDAFDHAFNIEFGDNTFINNYSWYNTLNKVLKNNRHKTMEWRYQLLLLTVKERLCSLSIAENPSGSSQSLVESTELLHAYDQAINNVIKLGAPPGHAEFHTVLLQHHKGQIALHAATMLLKKSKKDQLNWQDATSYTAPLMLTAWQSAPLDLNVNWLTSAPTKQKSGANRWYSEGAFRCSQAGHYLLSVIEDKNQTFLDHVSECYSGTHWRDKFYKKIFPSEGHLGNMKSSYIVSEAFSVPTFRIPRKVEVEAYDADAQKEYGNSLHHFVWILLHYKSFAHFNCTLFDMLDFKGTSCAPETLNKLDIHAFLYCATLTAQQQKSKSLSYMSSDKSVTLPANITDLLCSNPEMKWWDCAYKFSRNELGSELTDIRTTLSRGIEIVRCMDNHGLDPELLCTLGRIFSEQAKLATNVDVKSELEGRAGLYYKSAIPLLEKLKSKIVEKIYGKRMFNYTHKDLGTKEVSSLLEECKLYIAVNHYNNGEYDKVIEITSKMKSALAYFYLAQTYYKLTLEDINSSEFENKSKLTILLSKAKDFAFGALDKIRNIETTKNNDLYSNIQELIAEIETLLNKVEGDSFAVSHEGNGKFSSDESLLREDSEYIHMSNARVRRNISSTPKASTNFNATKYRTAIDTQILENTRQDRSHLEKIENEIKKLQNRDSNINDFMDQTKSWFEENRKLGNEIMSTIQSNMINTTDQFKLLTISVDQVKGEIDECRSEYKGIGELKKDIAELKKELNKLKMASVEQSVDDTESYNLEDEYRSNDNSASAFANRLQFPPAQVLPSFNQRIIPPFPVPPNTFQLYNQSLMNLYNQYSQYAQPSAVPAQSLFDPTRSQVNYPGVYPTSDQLYLDGAHFVPPSIPTVTPNMPSALPLPTMPNVPPNMATVPPSMPTIATGAAMPAPATSVATALRSTVNTKVTSKPLPVNVVITSSDPLPTCTTTPAPALSVTIPSKHIKGTPHNYQLPMPSTNVASPPVFVFPQSKPATSGTFSIWNQSSVFKNTPINSTSTTDSILRDRLLSEPKPTSGDALNTSQSVLDGIFNITSPNVSLNKSRTISEKSNTSVENYDPCPDFKPIVPLPAEVKVTTGEEDEIVIFNSRAKLFRFVDKQWKERGIGEMKLLKHKTSGKVRVLMRREQVHKICANHIITSDMEIKQMKNETKAYFWVANDFAEETVLLEKFCIRFKTADIALDFYNAFEQARLASVTSAVKPAKSQCKVETSKFNSDSPIQTLPTTQEKSMFGGFTFSSRPILKPVTDDVESVVKKSDEVSNKGNVFSGLSFKSSTASPNRIFNVNPTVSSPSKMAQSSPLNTSGKLNSSDTVEEYEPNVEFKPVVPLPALVDQKTGEEDENVLFEHRAKLLRFDTSSKEWKERGLGNIKLLGQKDNAQKIRLLMRREQIMKVCCNHAITKEMTFEKMPKVDKAVTWCAKDFSEGELVPETFCLRFKTPLLCDQFIEAIKTAQSIIKDESKSVKEDLKATEQTLLTGFGEKFKPKIGSWHCDSCYTNNLENSGKCVCCETPRPGCSKEAKPFTNTSPNVNITVSWGDKFKPKVGSWECQACFVRNDESLQSCDACHNPKDPSNAKTTTTQLLDNSPKFNFGIPLTNTATSTSTEVIKSVSATVNTDRNIFTPNSESLFAPNTGTVQFRFGMPPTVIEQKSNEKESIFDGTGAHKFSFGTPSNNSEGAAVFKEKENETVTKNALWTPIDLTVTKTNEQKTIKPALLPTPKLESSSSFVPKEDGKFNYVFKPKTDKSPRKSPLKDKEEESDDNEYVVEDECHQIFTPIIPLPDKVEVITGEENETELYGHMAKLYRFVSSEWKERGKGIVKILKHKDTAKMRVVMRRDQVLKICLNHSLSADVKYSPKDEKSWLFTVNDFSEGEVLLEYFCLRFKNKEIASEFKEAIDKAVQGGTDTVQPKPVKLGTDESDDVIFVNEIQASTEEKQKASELMLPENFFTYKSKEPCEGCRGCQDDQDSKSTSSTSKLTTKTKTETNSLSETKPGAAPTVGILKPTFSLSGDASTPLKGSTPLFQSPTNSVYGTPTSADKTIDTSIFRTPLGLLGSNTKTTIPATTQSSFKQSSKENTCSQISNLFSGFGQENTSSDKSQSKPVSIFSSSNLSTKSSILAPPKLSTVNPSNDQGESIFNSATLGFSKSPSSDNSVTGTSNIGVSINKSIFDNKNDGQNTDVKSVFGDLGKSENLFTSAHQGSIFGPGALTNNQGKLGGNIFGSSTKGGISLIKTSEAPNSIFGATLTSNVPTKHQATPVVSSNIKPGQKNGENGCAATIFKVDDAPTFAALSSTSSTVFKPSQNFKWEGAGEQLFVGKKQPEAECDRSHNESGGGDEETTGADEEYDPHYAPIVPLPDKIVVTTGEEDEEKVFRERCKLYRYDDKTREWKERGIGEIKLLYHPERKTYRLLLRREQVHKAVLNMLLHLDLELLQMKNTDRAWTWAGVNFAENPAGEQETLAVRFKSVELALSFQNQVNQCVRKLQAAAADEVRKEKETVTSPPAPLRLPKHLQETARADVLGEVLQRALATGDDASASCLSGEDNHELVSSVDPEVFKQVHFSEEEHDIHEEHDDDDDEYNEDDEENLYHSCDCEAIIKQGDDETTCSFARISVIFDQEICSPKIVITDYSTGEKLADMVIHTDTIFQMTGDSCVWSGKDYTNNIPVDKTIMLNFFDNYTALQFYDSCETSKAATYLDPEEEEES